MGYRDMVGLSVDVDEAQRADWADHLHTCRLCGDWYQEQQVRDRGDDPSRFPCVHIAYRVTFECSEHDDPWDCPDCVLVYSGKFDEYGIPVRDGGPSMISIQFCPWCGVELPRSRRDQWFETLAALGYRDPEDENIPEAFQSEEWWRART